MDEHVTCLITGADFLDMNTKRWIHGDLHQLYDILIFNATGCTWTDATVDALPEDSLAVRCDVFYEKNNQIVFPLGLCVFNEAANRFLNNLMRAEEPRIIVPGSNLPN